MTPLRLIVMWHCRISVALFRKCVTEVGFEVPEAQVRPIVILSSWPAGPVGEFPVPTTENVCLYTSMLQYMMIMD